MYDVLYLVCLYVVVNAPDQEQRFESTPGNTWYLVPSSIFGMCDTWCVNDCIRTNDFLHQ